MRPFLQVHGLVFALHQPDGRDVEKTEAGFWLIACLQRSPTSWNMDVNSMIETGFPSLSLGSEDTHVPTFWRSP